MIIYNNDLDGNYVSRQGTIYQHTAQGITTLQHMENLMSAFNVITLKSNEMIRILSVSLPINTTLFATIKSNNIRFFDTSSSITSFEGSTTRLFTESTALICVQYGTTNKRFRYMSAKNDNTTSITDFSEIVAPSGNNVNLRYEIITQL